MPTTRQSHIRHLLKENKAVVINSRPFTVRLKYDTPDIVQSVHSGLDTGRENIGIGASLEDGGGIYRAKVTTNNESVHEKMTDRKTCRQSRRRHARQKKQRKAMKEGNAIKNGQPSVLRNHKECRSVAVSYPGADSPVECKVIHGKEAQFANRMKSKDWLTPSGRQLIQMHVTALEKMCEILPISDLTVETVRFDFQMLENENITDWQHGPLYGYPNYKAYIRDIQNGRCLFCGYGPIEEYHHILPKCEGGSDTVRNIAGLCRDCHHGTVGAHKNKAAAKMLRERKEGEQSKYRISLLNSIMPYLLAELRDICEQKGIRFHVTNGYETFQTREKYHIPKDHDTDAYAISLADRTDIQNAVISDNAYQMRRFKKKSCNNIHTNGQREYFLNGKLVAIGRHKAENKKEDSLEEFRNQYGEQEVSKLTVRPAKRTYTYHKDGIVSPIHPGDVVRYEKHNKIKGNTKTATFLAESVSMSDGYVCHDKTKRNKLKFCKRIKSRCLQYT